MMNAGLTCAELRPLLGGYVLEALEPHEAEAVRAHLPGCPVCAAELASLAELPHLLDLAAPVAQPDEPLSPAAEEALLDRFARESENAGPRPRKRRRLPRIGFAWTRPRVAFVSAVLAAAVAVGAMSALDGGDEPQRASRNYIVALKPGPGAPDAKAHISLYRVEGRHRRAPVCERPPARLDEGLRDAVREQALERERGHVPRRRQRQGLREAHDRRASGGIRPRESRH